MFHFERMNCTFIIFTLSTFSPHKRDRKVDDKNSSSPWVLQKKRRKIACVVVKKAFVWPSAFMFSGEGYEKNRRFGHKILSTKMSERAYCCFYLWYTFFFAWVLKIEVINHWNHYFMDKCNYELGRGGRPKRQHCKCTTASGKPHFNNIIKFLLILFLSSSHTFLRFPPSFLRSKHSLNWTLSNEKI
jgi:hypothetical protein